MSFIVKLGGGQDLKTPWEERICKDCNSNKVEDEKSFIFKCTSLRRDYNTTNIYNVLPHENQIEFGYLIYKLLELRDNKIKQNKFLLFIKVQ
jgi:hypothetical protein